MANILALNREVRRRVWTKLVFPFMRRLPKNLRYLFTSYLATLALSVFIARPDLENPNLKPWLSGELVIIRLLHSVLYLEGGIAWVLNFVLLVPYAFFLTRIYAGISSALVVAFCSLFSMTIEAMQIIIPGRVADVRDIAANTAGALVWFLTYKFFLKINRSALTIDT
jgi:glycopeptide antibiotics resistance protein